MRWIFGKQRVERYLDYVVTDLPIYLDAIAHQNLHWAVVRKVYDDQEKWVRSALKGQVCDIQLPAVITLTRIAPTQLDFDNLVTAFKHIRDVVADLLIPGMQPGRADGDERLSWVYLQKKINPNECAVQIHLKGIS